MEKFKDKLIRFMYGRYGVDQLYYALFIAYFVLMAINMFLRWPLFWLLMLADLVWMIFRMFSRNHAARQRENAAFLRVWNPVKAFFLLTWNRIREFRTHVYAKCPHCKAVLRLPRRKGEHTVRCPRCQESFPIKVHFGEKKP